MPDSAAEIVKVTIETTFGNITADLFPDAAPITTTNFLFYLDQGLYDGGTFHRSVRMDNQPNDAVKIEVIQGDVNPERADEVGEAIPLERTTLTGLNHINGAISMGRFTPDSAKSHFFICIGDQPELDFGGSRNPDGQGFGAFGIVTSGMDVVREIQKQPVDLQALTPAIVIRRIKRD